MWPFSKKPKIKRASKLAVGIAAAVLALSVSQGCTSEQEKQRAQRMELQKQRRARDSINFVKSQEEKRKAESMQVVDDENSNPYSNPNNIENSDVRWNDVEDFVDIDDEKRIEEILSVGFDEVIRRIEKIPLLKKEIKKKYGGYKKFFEEMYQEQELYDNKLPKNENFSVIFKSTDATIDKIIPYIINNDIMASDYPFDRVFGGNLQKLYRSSVENDELDNGGFFFEFLIPYQKEHKITKLKYHIVVKKRSRKGISLLSDVAVNGFMLLNEEREIAVFTKLSRAEGVAQDISDLFYELNTKMYVAVYKVKNRKSYKVLIYKTEQALNKNPNIVSGFFIDGKGQYDHFTR